MFDIITQMVLHLLFYFINVCDVKRSTRMKADKRLLGRDREMHSDAGVYSDHNDVENIEFRNVFPKSCLVNEREYFNQNEIPFA